MNELCYVDIEDSLYVARNNNYLGCIGVGKTKDEAVNEFKQNLKEWLDAEKELREQSH